MSPNYQPRRTFQIRLSWRRRTPAVSAWAITGLCRKAVDCRLLVVDTYRKAVREHDAWLGAVTATHHRQHAARP